MSNHDTMWAEDMMSRARSKANGKPLENNTRLYEREDGKFAVKFHAVDVVTINPDGTFELRNGGWRTVTTLQRIRQFAPVYNTLMSVSGEWYLRSEPNPKDPRPEYVGRSIPKPYTAGDWREEPVKNDDGCIAGQLVTTEHVDEIVELMWRKDMREGDEFVEVTRESTFSDGDEGYDSVKVKRSWNDHVWIGEDAISYHDEGWQHLFPGTYNNTNTNADGETVKYVQCSHCQAFDAEYEAWRYWMHGERWGVRFDQQTGYKTYREMMDRFHNDKDLWQQGYIEDFRARRAYLKADREWDERNRVPFFDGIIVNSDGYVAKLRKGGPSPAKLRRHEAKVAKVKKAIDKYVDGFIAALKDGMPMPGGGDCFYCQMRRADTGQTLGDGVDTLHSDGSLTVEPNHDHLWSHIEEKYYVPSLVTNALLERGYKPVGVYMILEMNQDAQTMGGARGRYDGVKRDLRSYMSKRLIPQAPTS